MKNDFIKKRIFILIFAFVAVVGVYVVRLMQIQIVSGQDYVDKLNKGSSITQRIEAARGEIVDREGKPFTYNRVSYDIVFDRAFMPSKRENEIILKLISILKESDANWIDNLPITKQAPFEFLPDNEAEITKLKNFLVLGQYTNSENVIYWLKDRFSLEEYSEEDFRVLAGIKYGMQTKGFNYSTPYVFAKDINIKTATLIKELRFDLEGVDIIETAVREYSNGDLIPHIIGRVGPIYAEELPSMLEKGYRPSDYVGKDGIEYAYEDYLKGKDGTRKIFFNNSGDVVDTVDETEAEPGNTIMLTIDQDMQRVAIDALKAQIEHLNATAPVGKGKEADAGAVAAIDIKTGEILVLATYPSYDQSTYNKDYEKLSTDPLRPLWNRALLGRYSPGSIFKPCVAVGVLNEGIEDANSKVNCTRVYNFYPENPFTCLSAHGALDVKSALKYSCNIYFYDTGRRLGIEKINEYAHRLGLGVPTGVELNEFKGTVSSPEVAKEYGVKWNPGDVVQSSIGQMYNEFSPLQLANYTATLANDGKRMDVNLLKSINNYNQDTVVLDNKPTIISRMDDVSPEVFATVREGMVMASRSGTAVADFGNYFVDVASKTGTPQTQLLPNSTFIAYAPAEDPQIAVAVIIEKGWHGYTGAPVARKVMDIFFEKYGSVKPPQYLKKLEEEAKAKAAQSSQVNSDESSSEDNSEKAIQ
ncbi:MAG: penicillin-binding transpeptidase domain-containing protein [Oscillospiraceae bacterium]